MAGAGGGVSGPPRLAVVSDVVPVRSQGGELLLYRLLRDYPADRLAVVHAPQWPPFEPDRQLPGVRYEAIDCAPALPAVLRSRWLPVWPVLELAAMGRHARRVAQALGDFRPEAVLSVTDFGLWRAAARLARTRRLPLVLVQHDDLASKMTGNSRKPQYRLTRWLIDRQVGRAYRQAAARFCVSRGMAERHERLYRGRAEVLYPSRGDDSPEPRVRVNPDLIGRPPVVAFAGALYTVGACELLRQMAGLLAPLGGRLDLYTRATADELRGLDLNRPNVRLAGFFAPPEMAERMSDSAHLLFLPASFLPAEATDVSTLFPSKLADYTAVGLPLLVWGPAYSSAARWAADNPEAARLVADPDPRPVVDAVAGLAADPGLAARLATAALAAGGRDFSGGAARAALRAALAAAAQATTPSGAP